jgi:DNA repair and recombination protein RAD52
MQLNYLAGYDVIATANKLLGYGTWGYDLLAVEMNNVLGEQGELVGSYYSARVKLTVKDCIPITEEGVCAVQGGRNPKTLVDSHDMARKGAITDALKRAFRCYGDQFGNSLYDKDYDASTGNDNHQAPRQPAQRQAPAPAQQSRPAAPPPAAKAVTPATPNQAPKEKDVEKISQQGIDRIFSLAGTKGMDEFDLAKYSIELYGRPVKDLDMNEGRHFYQVLQGK